MNKHFLKFNRIILLTTILPDILYTEVSELDNSESGDDSRSRVDDSVCGIYYLPIKVTAFALYILQPNNQNVNKKHAAFGEYGVYKIIIEKCHNIWYY